MKTFLIDDEQAFLRYLAARTWTNDYVTASDKELQFEMQRENDLERQSRFMETLNEIKRNKCKTGVGVKKKVIEIKKGIA
jgi:hypothetical protein